MTKLAKQENTVGIRHSIATKLLRVVFALYIVITAVVTVSHMVMEYRYQKNNISRDLEGIQRTFEHALAVEMWKMGEESLQSTVKGMLEVPDIVGVEIKNDSGKSITIGGIVPQNGEVGDVGLHVNILGISQQDSMVHKGEVYNYELFEHQFPIVYTYQGQKKQLGEATIYSSTSVIFRRVKLGFLLLIVTTVFKIAVLWFIFMWVFKSILKQPLSILTTATEKVDLDNLSNAKVDIKRNGNDELTLLASSFNSMISNLQASLAARKQAEQEREKLLKTLAAKNKELQSVVYIASHDLKSPLVNITGFSATLNESCQQIGEILKGLGLSDEVMQQIRPIIDKDLPESIKFISAGIHKMKMLLDGLLQVSRVGTVDINIEPLDVSRTVSNVCKTMEFQLKEKDVDVNIGDLPECLGDEKMIDQLFSNLVGNALKYLMPDRKGKIDISGRVDGSESIYCVEDNGIGIHPDHQSKVFELFHRLNPDDSIGGEGLGLTIVSRILDRNNGSVWVESEKGKGSKFFVSLPTA